MKNFAALATVILLLQSVFSLHQVGYYNRFIRELAKRYSNKKGFRLETDVAKNLFFSAVAAVIIDADGKIQELYYYSGLTIFSKFKRIYAFDEKKVSNELMTLIEAEKSVLKKKVFKQLIKKEMETVTI